MPISQQPTAESTEASRGSSRPQGQNRTVSKITPEAGSSAKEPKVIDKRQVATAEKEESMNVS